MHHQKVLMKKNSSKFTPFFTLAYKYAIVISLPWYICRFLQDVQSNEQQHIAELKRKENEEIQHFKDIAKNKHALQTPDNSSTLTDIIPITTTSNAHISESTILAAVSSSSSASKRQSAMNPIIKGTYLSTYCIHTLIICILYICSC